MRNIYSIILRILCAMCGSASKPPAKPKSLGVIKRAELRTLLQQHFPNADIHLGDADYELTSCDEWLHFMKWYHDRHKYSWDEYDCDKFAWIMRAEAIKWMDGKFVFGYIEAEGIDEEHSFPNHGFCFIINEQEQIYFCDELCVAAPNDDLEPVYPVRAYLVKA